MKILILSLLFISSLGQRHIRGKRKIFRKIELFSTDIFCQNFICNFVNMFLWNMWTLYENFLSTYRKIRAFFIAVSSMLIFRTFHSS